MDVEDAEGIDGAGQVVAAAIGLLDRFAEGVGLGSRGIGEVVLGEKGREQESRWAAGQDGSYRLVAGWAEAAVVGQRRPGAAVGEAASPLESW